MTNRSTVAKSLAVVLSTLVVASLVALTAGVSGSTAALQTGDVTVNDDGSADYQQIQEAVNNSSPGDTIVVEAGTYEEEVTVDVDDLSIVAASGATPVLDGAGTLNTSFSILNDGVSIDGFEVRNYDLSEHTYNVPPVVGVTGNNVVLSNLTITGNTGASEVVQVDGGNVELVDSVVTANDQGDAGIRVDGTGFAMRNSTVTENQIGVYILANDATVENSNVSLNDERGITLRAIDGAEIDNTTINDNVEEGVYQTTGFNTDANNVTVTNSTISGNGGDGAIDLFDGSFATIKHNDIYGNSGGIKVSNNATVVNNTLEAAGVSAGDSSVVLDNEITNAPDSGVAVGDRSRVEHNTVHTSASDITGTSAVPFGIGVGGHSIVTNNDVSTDGVWGGLVLSNDAVNTTVSDNTMENGVYFTGGELPAGLEDNPHEMTNNVVDGGPLYFASNEDNPSIDPSATQVVLINVTNAEISGFTFSDVVAEIQVAFSEDVTIRDNTVTDSGPMQTGFTRHSFGLWGTTNATVTGNTIGSTTPLPDNQGAVLVSQSENVTVADNELYGEAGKEASTYETDDFGVMVRGSIDVAVENNLATQFSWGVETRNTDGLDVTGNTFESTYQGASVRGSTVTFIDNTVSGSDVGLAFSEAGDVLIENNTVSGNAGTGIDLRDVYSTAQTTVTDNTVRNNNRGIYLTAFGYSGELENVTVSGNEIENNAGTGVFLDDPVTESMVITSNSITGNGDGITYYDSQTLNATNNWWGSGTGPSGGVEDPVTGVIADGGGDSITSSADAVAFDPWLDGDPTLDPDLGLPDFAVGPREDGQTFDLDVTVEEMNSTETENLVVSLAVKASDGTLVYDETIDAPEVAGETVTVTFGVDDGTPELGPYATENAEYTATVTADADNADVVEAVDTFRIVDPIPNNEITECSVVASGGSYDLVSDISENAAVDSTCIEIAADDVILQGNGHTLESTSGDGTGILVTGDNVTVENLDVTGWATGVELSGATNSLIAENNLSTNAGEGIYLLSDSNDNTIRDNTLIGNDGNGISLNAVHRNTIRDNVIHNNSYRGIALSGGGSTENVIESNTISSSGIFGIGLSGVQDNVFARNTITDSEMAGIGMTDHDTTGNEFVENVLSNNAGPGIRIEFGANENAFVDNVAFGNDWGVTTYTNGVTMERLDLVDTDSPQISLSFDASGVQLREAPTAPANGDLIRVGYAFEVGQAGEGGSLDISVAYDAGAVSDVDQSTLDLHRYDFESETWVSVGATVDTGANTVSATLTDYTTYALFGEEVNETTQGDESEEDEGEETDTTGPGTGVDAEEGDDAEGDDGEDDGETTVQTESQSTATGASSQSSVQNAKAGERVGIEVPDPEEEQNFEVDEVALTPAQDGDFTLDIETSSQPLDSTPDAEFRFEGTEELGYASVDASIDNADIEQSEFIFRVDEEEIEGLESSPEDVAMYQYNEETDSWEERPTEFLGQEDGELILQTTGDGFSEWTAAAKTPELDITDTQIDVEVATTEEDVTIQVFVTNTGGADGTYEAQLVANGEVVDREDATVPANRTVIIDFVRTFDQPGEYEVQVNDVTVGEIEITDDEEVVVGTPTPTPTDSTASDGEGGTPTDDETEGDGGEATPTDDTEDDDGGALDGFGPGFGVTTLLGGLAILLSAAVARHRRQE